MKTIHSRYFLKRALQLFTTGVFLILIGALSSGCGSAQNSSGGGSLGGGGGSGSNNGSQPTRFRMTNQCQYTIWIQQQNMPAGTAAVTELAQGTSVDFNIPDAGLASTRFWPKTGCDNTGQNCTLGQSSPPCPMTPSGCSPPVDSKIEATWGCILGDPSQCASTPQGDKITTTFYNSSAVDGFTLPFTVTVTPNGGSTCNDLNCSTLELSECPSAENLSQGQNQQHPQYSAVDLKVVDPGNPGVVAGCFSPCKALDYPGWGGQGIQNEQSDEEIMYCCPTPPISSGQCQGGPVPDTQYVGLIHQKCSGGVYGYAYDDGIGLHNCSAATEIEMTFGPNCP